MSTPSTERTLLWADVSEFTRAMEASEPLMADRTSAWVERCTHGWLPGLGGEFLSQAGDALILAFESPELALKAAHRLQEDWHSLAPRLAHDEPMPLRIALHWGSVRRGGLSYVANSLNQLARLAQQVTAGEIWVSADVMQRWTSPERPPAQDLGWMYFKHLTQPLRVFRLPPTAQGSSTVTAPAPGDLPRVLVVAGPGTDAMLQTQHWVGQLLIHGGLEVTGVPWPGFEVNPIDLLQKARADFLLRRQRMGDPTVWELRAAPQAIVLLRWPETIGPVSSNPELTAQTLFEAMQVHSASMALSQPDRALSHGLLRMSTLQLMHNSPPQHPERVTGLLQAWADRQPRLAEPHIWRAQWEVLRHTRGHAGVNTELAVHHANQALRLAPEDGQAWASRGFVLAHLCGDLDRGLRDLEEAVHRPQAEPWASLYRSVLWSMLRQTETAQHWAQQAMLRPPAGALRPHAWGLVGHATLIHGQAAASLRWLEASWRAQRQHSPTLRMLVVAHQMLGQASTAAFFLRELLTLEPNLTARSYLGRTRAGHGLRVELAHWLMAAGLPMK